MAEWTSEAREYLDGYLKQIAVLVREQGDDPGEVVAELRDHIANEVEAGGESPVSLGLLLPVLSELGAPEDVASIDLATLKLAPSKRAADAPPAQRPAAPATPRRTKSVVVHRHRSPASCVMAVIMAGVAGLFALAVLGIVAAIVIPAMIRARQAAYVEQAETAEAQALEQQRQAICQSNLEQLGRVLNTISEDAGGTFPPVDLHYSVVMFNVDTIVPAYMDTLSAMTCPGGPHEGRTFDDVDSEYAFEFDYVYCSHAVTNDREFAAYLDAIAEAKRRNAPLTEPIVLANGTELPRLNSSKAPGSAIAPSDVPVLIERPGRHPNGGYNVLYLDGHVEYGEVGEGRFPWTEAVEAALTEMGGNQ